MAENFFNKAKRNVGRAFDFRGSSDIRNSRDVDETSSNLDYMLSRGKNRTPQDQSDTEAGKRTQKKVVPELSPESFPNKFLGIRKKITDTIQGDQSSNQGPGVASSAMNKQASNRGPMYRGDAPAVRLFRNMRRKKDDQQGAA